jgi:hypothetical protein
MKYVLAAMCGLVVLFMGGCSVLLLPSGFFALGPGLVAFLNLAILGGLFGWKVQWLPAYYILAVADALIALVCGYIAVAGLSFPDAGLPPLMLALAAVFALKAALTFIYARNRQTST